MIRGAFAWIAVIVLFGCLCGPGWCGRLEGKVTDVTEYGITAEFPARVRLGSAMMVMSGRGESIAGVAISQSCEGDGPYVVSGQISWVNDTNNFKAGKVVYVNSLNASAIPTRTKAGQRVEKPKEEPTDLGFYYYSAAQNVGYGTFGVGLEKALNIGGSMAIEVDGALTSLGNVDDTSGTVIDTDYLIKTMNGRVKLDLVTGFALYGGYRWNEGRGNDERWDRLVDGLNGKSFIAASQEPNGQVQLTGTEYGIVLNPAERVGVSVGYMPKMRTDYGGLGVLSEPAYTAEIRFGSGSGGVRLRGLRASDYWMADLGITIR